MKVFSVFGVTGSGKTTTIECVIRELTKRRYSVGSLKDIHFEQFAMDTKGTNTDRHRQAGAELVTARGLHETDVLYPRSLGLDEILRHYSQDYVVLEGVSEGNFPKIISAHTTKEVDQRWDRSVVAISGRLANEMQEYRGLPVINAVEDAAALVDLIEAKVFPKLPDFPEECCSACGMNCRDLGMNILSGEAAIEDCVLRNATVELEIGGQAIPMVPFVQTILSNAVEGVVKELDGWQPNREIVVKLRGQH